MKRIAYIFISITIILSLVGYAIPVSAKTEAIGKVAEVTVKSKSALYKAMRKSATIGTVL